MSFDWSGAGPIRINVVSWPIAEQLGGTKERAQWRLVALDDPSGDELEAGLASLPAFPSASGMEVAIEVAAAGELLMSCVYDSSVPEPMRLGGVSLTWRFLDEELARLWIIGDRPRSWFPEFMRQRRAQLDALSLRQRMSVMFASVTRIEPLIGAAGGISGSTALRVTDTDEEAAVEALRVLTARLAASLSGHDLRRTSGDQEKADLGPLLVGLSGLVERAVKSGDTNDIARCLEEVFDTFHLFDQHYHATSFPLARREDRGYRDDLDLLFGGDAAAVEAVLERAIGDANSIREAIAGVDVRGQLVV